MNPWPSKPLREVADVIMGQSPPGESYNTSGRGVPLLNGPTEYGERNPTAKQWTTEPTRLCEPGDILFCVRGSTTGRMNWADRQYCLGRGLAAIRAKPTVFVAEFLALNLSYHVEQVVHRADEGVFPNLDKSELKAFEIPVPPLAEQRRIVRRVEALTHRLDQARQARQAAFAETQLLLNSLREDIYQELLNEFPNKPLGECGEVLGGGTPSKAEERYWNGNIAWVTAKEMWKFDVADTSLKITERAVTETAVKLVPPGSVLFVVRGSVLFKRVPVAVNRIQCTINQDMKAIVPIAELDGDLLAHMLWGANEILKGMVDTAGNSAGKLPTERWKTLPIPVPPPKEQKKVVARLAALREKLDELRRLQREVEVELAAFTPALLAKAFRRDCDQLALDSRDIDTPRL